MPFDITDPETKAAFDAAIADAKTGLETKNSELLDEVKKIKLDLRKHKDIDPADLENLESENERLRGDLTKAQKDAKEAIKTSESATKALEAESGVTHKLIVENGIIKALTDAGVNDPAYLEAAKAMHFGNVKVVADGDVRKAMYGEKELEAAIKEWAGSDVGKKFVSAPINSGGGGTGGKGGGDGKTASQSDFNAMGAKDRAAFFDAGGAISEEAA